jgi:hypothetical protein
MRYLRSQVILAQLAPRRLYRHASSIAQTLHIPRGSSLYRIVVTILTFGFSGVLHAVELWALSPNWDITCIIRWHILMAMGVIFEDSLGLPPAGSGQLNQPDPRQAYFMFICRYRNRVPLEVEKTLTAEVIFKHLEQQPYLICDMPQAYGDQR